MAGSDMRDERIDPYQQIGQTEGLIPRPGVIQSRFRARIVPQATIAPMKTEALTLRWNATVQFSASAIADQEQIFEYFRYDETGCADRDGGAILNDGEVERDAVCAARWGVAAG